MSIDPCIKSAHARLSATSRRFLDFVEGHPECAERSSFPQMEPSRKCLAPYPLQSWPMFVDPPVVREFERAATLLPKLIQTLPERIFDNDPEQIVEYYGFDRRFARLMAGLLKHPRFSRGMAARGDFIYGPDGLKCMEVNMNALGGLQSADWAAAYRRVPLIERFLAEDGAQVVCRDTIEALLSYVYREARGLASEGELNLVFRVPPCDEVPEVLVRYSPKYQKVLDRRWKDLLEREGFDGTGHMWFRKDRELEMKDERLTSDGHRIHAVVEYAIGQAPRAVLIPWMLGRLQLFNGALKGLWGDKRNLALLSEHGDSDLFDAEERAVIRDFVPWSRRVQPGPVTFEGREMEMAELLVAERERLVIKPIHGFQGRGVHIGHTTSDGAWRQTVEAALRDGGQLAQEYVESLPLLFQEGSSGSCPHTVVWGLFTYGDTYAGGFLRMSPNRGEQAVVNTNRGALEGVFFEVSGGPESQL